MISALVIANTEKSVSFFNENLSQVPSLCFEICENLNFLQSKLNDFQVLIIYQANNSLQEIYNFILQSLKFNKTQILLIENKENYEKARELFVKKGVVVLEKPISVKALQTSIEVIFAMNLRIGQACEETEDLKQKIDDIKIIDRAKCILISNIKMTEVAAHKYIEKQAMDFRKSKREIALNILKTYEN